MGILTYSKFAVSFSTKWKSAPISKMMRPEHQRWEVGLRSHGWAGPPICGHVNFEYSIDWAWANWPMTTRTALTLKGPLEINASKTHVRNESRLSFLVLLNNSWILYVLIFCHGRFSKQILFKSLTPNEVHGSFPICYLDVRLSQQIETQKGVKLLLWSDAYTIGHISGVFFYLGSKAVSRW